MAQDLDFHRRSLLSYSFILILNLISLPRLDYSNNSILSKRLKWIRWKIPVSQERLALTWCRLDFGEDPIDLPPEAVLPIEAN